MEEIWKVISEFPKYEISNIGRCRYLLENNKYKYCNTDKSSGYEQVTFYLYDNNPRRKIHRLVAEAFLDKNDFKYMDYENIKNIKKLYVNHKDENGLNNSVENLEWCTIAYNNNYKNRCCRNGNNKILQIKDGNVINTFKSATDACKYNNKFIGTHILACCRHKRKSHAGYCWEFEEKYNNDYAYNQTNKINKYDLFGNFIETLNYSDLKEYDITTIIGVCKGDFAQYKGFMWRYNNGDENINISPFKPISRNRNPILKYDLKHNLVEEYPTMKDACIKNNISKSSILSSIKVKRPTKNFYYEYKFKIGE